jgi:hypothetical protein
MGGQNAGGGSAAGVELAEGVGSTVGVRMEEKGDKCSCCAVGGSFAEGPSRAGCPEVIGFIGVGLGVSSVVFLFCRHSVGHPSKIYISAQQTASSPC